MLSNILDLLLRKHFQGKIMQNIVSAPVGWCDGAGYNFQCRGVLLIWIIVRHGPAALAVCASEGCLEIFLLVYHFSLSSLSLGDGRYRLRYCLKGPLNPKHQPTNPTPHLHPFIKHSIRYRCFKNANKIYLLSHHYFKLL